MASFIDIKFNCKCGHTQNFTESVPEPDYAAEHAKDSFNDYNRKTQCYQCDTINDIYITNSFSGVTCCVNNGANIVAFTPLCSDTELDSDLDWLIGHSEQFCIFEMQLDHVKGLLAENITEEHEFGLHAMLYAHTIAAIECYLASTFIHQITNSRTLTKKLVETDPFFGNQSFSLKELFTKQDSIPKIVADYLEGIIFHNIAKVRLMYKNVLNIDFGMTSWLFQAVNIRHDCVHRAGYDKNGNPNTISEAALNDLVESSWNFVCLIENQIKEKVWKIENTKTNILN